jgi:DNA-binding MarR family transcriptional regulator
MSPVASTSSASESMVGTADGELPSLLTNHGQALLCLLRDPSVRIRDVGLRIGTTERRAQSIVNDLVEAGLVRRHRVGRRNHYEVPADHEHLGRAVRELAAALDPTGEPFAGSLTRHERSRS